MARVAAADERSLRHARNARSRAARARAPGRAAAATRARQGERAGIRAHPRRYRSRGDHDARGPCARAGDAQVGALRAAERRAAVRRPRRSAPRRARARVRFARADLRTRGPLPGLLAARARALCRGFSPRRSRPQLLLVSLHAGRLDARDRRARARLHGVRRRRRPDRAAGAGDRRPRARRLCRHALVPQDHRREGGRDGRRVPQPYEGARFGRSVSAEPSRRARRARDRGHIRPTRPRTSAASPTRPRHARAS